MARSPSSSPVQGEEVELSASRRPGRAGVSRRALLGGLGAVLGGEAHVGQHIRLGVIHQGGQLRELGAQLVGDGAPLAGR